MHQAPASKQRHYEVHLLIIEGFDLIEGRMVQQPDYTRVIETLAGLYLSYEPFPPMAI